MREEFLEILKIPTVSGDPKHQQDIRRCAIQLASYLESIGFSQSDCWETDGNPIVYAEWMKAQDKPVILLYAHYDVQPAGDAANWESPPFEPVIRQGKLYGRGSVDNKGQLFIQLEAIRTLLEQDGTLPVNLKIVIEGEEEIGSPSFDHFLKKHENKLSCDAVIISDTSMLAQDVPSVCHGLRGIVGFELEVTGPVADLHSGSFFGGAVANPLQALVNLLASMKATDGSILIDGFYDQVSLAEEERNHIQQIPFDEAALAKEIGVSDFVGEPRFTHLEKVWTRPTFEINGITGGGTGTIIPHKATAYVTCRLVPGQDPLDIQQKIEKHILAQSIKGVQVALTFSKYAYPYLLQNDHPLLSIALRSLEEAYGRKSYLIRAGGTIPVVEMFHRLYRVPVVMLGFGLPDSKVHGPNEHMPITQFHKGVETLTHFYRKVAEEGLAW